MDATMKPSEDQSDLRIVKRGPANGKPHYYEVVGDLDSCGHRHDWRKQAEGCKRALECDHAADWSSVAYDRNIGFGFSGPVLDVACEKCGRSGSFIVTPDSINWA